MARNTRGAACAASKFTPAHRCGNRCPPSTNCLPDRRAQVPALPCRPQAAMQCCLANNRGRSIRMRFPDKSASGAFGEPSYEFQDTARAVVRRRDFARARGHASAEDKVKIGAVFPMTRRRRQRRRPRQGRLRGRSWTSSTTPIPSSAISRWPRMPASPASAAPRSRSCSPTTRAAPPPARTRRCA